jgi:hypothetical protein
VSVISETTITRNIIKLLNTIPKSRWRKTIGGETNPGEPDISGCIDGRRVEIEIKVPGNKSTPIQKRMQDLWENAGAIVFRDVNSVNMLIEMLENQGIKIKSKKRLTK